MAHNTRTRANLTAWGTGAVTDVEFDKLDGFAFKSINGDEGGVWSPSSVIEIGGQGLLMSGPFETTGVSTFNGDVFHNEGVVFNGNANFRADTTIGSASSDDLEVIATATFDNDVFFTDDVIFDDSVVFNDPVSFTDDVTFSDPVTFNDTADFNDPVTFDDAVTFSDLVTLSGATVNLGNSTELNFGTTARIIGTPTLGVRLRYDDAGRVPFRLPANLSNSSQSVTVADGNFFVVGPQGTDKTFTIDDTGASPGDHMFFMNGSSGGGAADAIIEFGTGPSQVTIPHSGGKAQLFVRGNSTWFRADFT